MTMSDASTVRTEMIPGISAAISSINETIQRYATTPGLVFITGEPGTEKSLASKMLHYLGPRAERPISKVTVSWKMPPELVQHVDRAAEGTLVIVLQREFPIDMQFSIVEMISHGVFTDPLGGASVECPNIGLILLASQTFENFVSQRTGTLLPEVRELLEARRIHIPPLRERPEDIPALTRYAVRRARETGRSKALGADAQVLALFRHWHWPNNAEELLLVSAQAAIAASGEMVTMEDLPEEFLAQLPQDLVAAARAVRAPRPAKKPTPRRPPTTPLALESSPFPLPGGTRPITPPQPERSDSDDETPIQIVVPDLGGDESRPVTHSDVDTQEEDPIPRRLLTLAKRLSAQSHLLQQQVNHPLQALKSSEGVPKLDTAPAPAQPLNQVEEELERGLDMVLALRRQLVTLNQRQRETVVTVKDIFRRIRFTRPETLNRDPDFELEKDALAEQLRAINSIIDRINRAMPDGGEGGPTAP